MNIQGLPNIDQWTPPWGYNAPQPVVDSWAPYDPGGGAAAQAEEPAPEEQ